MLVLSRQRDQTIRIGHDIEITVVDIRGDKVRLGITAPRQVSVHRQEVYETILKENHLAARPATVAVPPGATAPLAAPVAPHGAAGNDFLAAALGEAQASLREGGLPIGAVLVRDGHIIACGHNRCVQDNDPMAHAEIDCLKSGGPQTTYRDTVLYCTLMPCYLCAGAVVQLGIPRVVAGASRNDRGPADFLRARGVEVVELGDQACLGAMADFVAAHGDMSLQDVGA